MPTLYTYRKKNIKAHALLTPYLPEILRFAIVCCLNFQATPGQLCNTQDQKNEIPVAQLRTDEFPATPQMSQNKSKLNLNFLIRIK